MTEINETPEARAIINLNHCQDRIDSLEKQLESARDLRGIYVNHARKLGISKVIIGEALGVSDTTVDNIQTRWALKLSTVGGQLAAYKEALAAELSLSLGETHLAGSPEHTSETS